VPIGVYPGSFNPPTIAHLAIAEAAVHQLGLDRIDLVISIDPLGKDGAGQVRLRDRLTVLHAVAAERPWLEVRSTEHRLITDIADGYDVIVVGADKWAQMLDPRWYGNSVDSRDRAVASLGTVALAPRPVDPSPADHPIGRVGPVVVELDLHPSHRSVSATSVRAGRREWMANAAAAFDEETGAWSDPDRYERWRRVDPGDPDSADQRGMA